MKPVHYSRRVHYLIFLFIAMLVVIMHYPLTPHQLGADSYLIHAYGEVITREGHAPWVVHPLSYFGFYPDSYPAAVPYLLSTTRQLSGLDMETTVYFVSLTIGLLGLIGMYMLSGAILNDDRFKFISSFGYATSPLIIKFTNWTISTRGLFLVLLPIFLWMMLKSSRSIGMEKVTYIISSVLLLLIMAFVHRMFWYAIVMFIVFMVVSFLHSLVLRKASYKRYTERWENSTLAALGLLILASLGILGLILGNTTLPIIGRELATTVWEPLVALKNLMFALILVVAFASIFLWFISGERRRLKNLSCFLIVLSSLNLLFIQFTDMAPWRTEWWVRTRIAEYSSTEMYLFPTTLQMLEGIGIEMGARIGLFLIPAFLAILFVPLKSLADERRVYPIAVVMVFLPFIHIAMYFYQAISPFMYILASLLLVIILSSKPILLDAKRWKKAVTVVVVLFIVASLAFTVYTVTFRADRGEDGGVANYLRVSEYSVAMYFNEYEDAPLYGGGRLMAFTNWIPDIDSENVIVSRPPAPPISDFQGWYSFLKQPIRWERMPAERIPRNVMTSHDHGHGGYTLYGNGVRNIWYNPNA